MKEIKIIDQNTSGEIREVQRGHKYRIRVCLPPDIQNPKWHWSKMRTVNGNKNAAVAALVAYKEELQNLKSMSLSTVEQYANHFQDNRDKLNRVSKLTVKRDKFEIDRIIKYLGSYPIKDLESLQIERAYIQMAKDGVSQYSLNRTHIKLKQMLNKAVREGQIPSNPCFGVDGIVRPKRDREKLAKQRLTKEQALELFHILQEEEKNGYIVAVWLALTTGMRRGEVLGLQWKNVDLDKKKIRIVNQLGKEQVLKEPKTEKSKRVISIDDVTVKFLTEWKSIQKEQFNKAVVSFNKNSPVCSNSICEFVDPDNFGRWRRKFFIKIGFAKYTDVKEWTDRRGIKRYKYSGYVGPTFHALRHAQATLLVAGGVDPKTVQARLGHEKISTTLEIYAEALEENDEKAADYIAGLINGG